MYNRHDDTLLHYSEVKFLTGITASKWNSHLDQAGTIVVLTQPMKRPTAHILHVRTVARPVAILAIVLLCIPQLVNAQTGTRAARRSLAQNQTGVKSRVQSGRNAQQETQYHRARTAWESGISLLEAKARIDRVLVELPEDTDALKLRASILMGLGRKEEAIDDALLVVQLDSADGEGQLLLCETAMANGNSTIAITALAAASDLIVTGVPFLIRLAACALSADETARAEALARIAVAQNERDPRGQIQLARIFLKTERVAAAQSILDRLINEGLVTRSLVIKDADFSALYSSSNNQ